MNKEEKEDIIEYLEELLEGLQNRDIKITNYKKFKKAMFMTIESSEQDLDVLVEKSVLRELYEEYELDGRYYHD